MFPGETHLKGKADVQSDILPIWGFTQHFGEVWDFSLNTIRPDYPADWHRAHFYSKGACGSSEKPFPSPVSAQYFSYLLTCSGIIVSFISLEEISWFLASRKLTHFFSPLIGLAVQGGSKAVVYLSFFCRGDGNHLGLEPPGP